MTCIVAIIHNGQVTMGADSAGAGGTSLTVRKDPKIFTVGEFLIGFTSSFRMGQLLGYQFQPPKHHPDVSIERYMHTEWIEAVRDCLKRGGYARSQDGEESGGCFLVGYRGRIFSVQSDFQLGENVTPYDATGCGMDLALGALHALTHVNAPFDPKQMCRIALQAAEQFSSGVRGPFHIHTQVTP